MVAGQALWLGLAGLYHAVSFVTNTNWQSYSGETAMSHWLAPTVTRRWNAPAGGVRTGHPSGSGSRFALVRYNPDGTIEIFSATQAMGQGIATIPEFFWELLLGIYLIVKGFRPSPILEDEAVRFPDSPSATREGV